MWRNDQLGGKGITGFFLNIYYVHVVKPFLSELLLKMRKIPYLLNKVRIGKTVIPYSLINITLSYNYLKFQENPLTIDTQNECLKRTCFG